MSATNRGAERVPFDEYPTPAWTVHRLLEGFAAIDGRVWLDPCAGQGGIVRAVLAVRPGTEFHAIEIQPGLAEGLTGIPGVTAYQGDYLETDCSSIAPGVIITNPPYSRAELFLRKALDEAPVVAMLLRLGFLASAQRAEFMRTNAPSVYVLPDRPQFRRNSRGRPGSDATDYAWFVYQRAFRWRTSGRVTVLATTPPEERRV